jgi:hypothetical protein
MRNRSGLGTVRNVGLGFPAQFRKLIGFNCRRALPGREGFVSGAVPERLLQEVADLRVGLK